MASLHAWIPPCHTRGQAEWGLLPPRRTLADPGGRGQGGLPAGGQALGPPSRVFQNVGCDFEIDSGAVEDRCGVCHGNGSTCHTVSGTFEESEGLGMRWGGGVSS